MSLTLNAEHLDVHINDWGTTVRYRGLRVTDTRGDAASPSRAMMSPSGPFVMGPVVHDAVEVSS
jgi:hypothetical protein